MSAEVTHQLILLFALMSIGFFIKKIGLIDKPGGDKLSSFISNITMPALYIATFMQRFSLQRLSEGAALLGISALFYIIGTAASILFVNLFRVPAKDRGVYRFLIIFSNAAFMGYPVLTAIFHNAPGDALFYAVFFNLPFNLLAFTFGVWLLRGGDGGGFSLKALLLPGSLAALIGLGLFLISPLLPNVVYTYVYEGWIHDTFKLLGDTTIPLSMIVIGTVLAEIRVKDILFNARIYAMSVFRLLIVPAAMFGIIALLPLGKVTGGVPVVISAMPCAVFSVILSKEYGGDEKLASVGVFITTLASFLTIPLLSLLYT